MYNVGNVGKRCSAFLFQVPYCRMFPDRIGNEQILTNFAYSTCDVFQFRSPQGNDFIKSLLAFIVSTHAIISTATNEWGSCFGLTIWNWLNFVPLNWIVLYRSMKHLQVSFYRPNLFTKNVVTFFWLSTLNKRLQKLWKMKYQEFILLPF